MAEPAGTVRQRSGFVTGLAWIFIGLALTALFLWIIRHLVSADVRKEFSAG
jgi:hypothetical protein